LIQDVTKLFCSVIVSFVYTISEKLPTHVSIIMTFCTGMLL